MADILQKMLTSARNYVTLLTIEHEDVAWHMYNTQNKGSGPDVTCGIGFKLANEKACLAPAIRDMFYDPAAPHKPVRDEQLKADWHAAHDFVRGAAPNYANYCKLRMHDDKGLAYLDVMLAEKLNNLLKAHPHTFELFEWFPACAQVACLSFAYSLNPRSTGRKAYPQMLKAIEDWDFRAAAAQCNQAGLFHKKNQAHKTLFLNAAWVIDFNADDPAKGLGYELVPQALATLPDWNLQPPLGKYKK